MQRRINEAEGRAQEIEAIAEATARSIEEVADALMQPGGTDAMQLQLKEKYIGLLSGLGRKENQIIIPKDLSNYDALMEGLSLSELNEKKKK